jgi:hypothetical protein
LETIHLERKDRKYLPLRQRHNYPNLHDALRRWFNFAGGISMKQAAKQTRSKMDRRQFLNS